MATEESDEVQKLPPDARLDSLEQRLERVQRIEAERTARPAPNPSNRIWQLLFSHLIGAPVGGGVIGWGLDSLFGTFPLFFLLILFVGFGVGVVNVMRISRNPPGLPGEGSEKR